MAQRRTTQRKAASLAALACLLIVGLWIAGLILFFRSIPESPPTAATTTDAIVVLTGGSGRLDKGLDLLAAKRARKLFVSGVYRGVDVAQLLEISRRLPEDFICCVTVGHSAVSTSGNATETAAWIERNGYRSLSLVTANYHMPRSMLEFRHAMPEIIIVPHPVFPEQFKRERWWAWPGSTSLVVTEYMKFTLAWLRHAIGGLAPGGVG